jgi:hypothetical protein
MLDVSQRAEPVADLMAQLRYAIPGPEARLRGSLGTGHADPYSDIDLLWDVPDLESNDALAQLPEILARGRPLASLRYDPDFQRSAKPRSYSSASPECHSSGASIWISWPAPSSAIRTTTAPPSRPVARIGQQPRAARRTPSRRSKLMQRAEQRVVLSHVASAVPDRILRLVDAVAEQDPSLATRASEIRRLVANSF